MSEEKKAEGPGFEQIVSEVKRWASILERTADHILETGSKNDKKEDKK